MGKHGVLIMAMGLLALYAKAQTHISGRVTDSASKAPLPYASVYVVNTTIGTQTNDKGIYDLSDLPAGNHQIIVSLVGYGTKLAEVKTSNKDATADVVLAIKSTELKEVKIDLNGWQHNLNLFKREFLGTDNSAECVIRNEGILDMDFTNNRLTAKTNDFLNIDNKVLGYKLRFLVKDFFADYNTGQCKYRGSIIFEALHGTKAEEKKWTKNRLDVYNASFRHFLVSLTKNQASKDKFIIRRMIRKSNMQQFSRNGYMLDKQPLRESDIVKPGAIPGTFNLQFSDYIYVIYTKKEVGEDTDNLFRFPEARDYQIAAVSMKNANTPTVFNSKGILISKESLYCWGAWSSRMIDLLPDDYEPPQK